MATSGSVSFTMDARKIVERAFSKIGVKKAEQPLEADEFQDGIDSLNLMLATWRADGLHLWTKDEGIVFLDAGKADYNLGPTGDKACQLDDFVGSTTTAAKIATDVIIDISSTDGMVALDNVGIELDDNTRHWTTIVSVDSATQITITTGLPSGSKSGSSVFTFTNLIERPNRILSYRRKTFNQDNEIEVLPFSRDQYFNQVNKLSRGTVVNAYYSPQINNGRVYVWQTASSVNDFVRFTFERSIEEVLIGDDNLDLPNEWLETVIYGLAARLIDDYDTPIAKGDRITQKSAALLDQLLGWDEEMGSLNLQPDFT